MIEVWQTCVFGTYSSGKFKVTVDTTAKIKRAAIRKAKAEVGPIEASQWTYYCPDGQFKGD